MRRLYERSLDAAIVSQTEIDQMVASGTLKLDDESPQRGECVFGVIVDTKQYVIFHYIHRLV